MNNGVSYLEISKKTLLRINLKHTRATDIPPVLFSSPSLQALIQGIQRLNSDQRLLWSSACLKEKKMEMSTILQGLHTLQM